MEFNKELEEYFKELNVEFILFPEKTKKTYKSLKALYDFITKEKNFWEECISGEVAAIRSSFSLICNNIENAKYYFEGGNNIEHAKRLMNEAVTSLKRNSYPTIFSTTKIGRLIKARYQINPMQGNAACDYYFNRRISYPNDFNYSIGLMNCIIVDEFSYANKINTDAEKGCLNDLHKIYSEGVDTIYNEYVSVKNQVNDEVDIFKNGLMTWKSETEEKINKVLDEKEKKLEELEKYYNEQLRLEGPAKHWKNLETEYKVNGDRWRMWAVITSTVFILFLTALLFSIPQTIFEYKGVFSTENLRGSIILALISSVGIYIIRLFVKLSTSAYHLSTDAKERYQLTCVFLSLLKEKGVADQERSIVIQSIFSRADTGLLKGDSSPTLPEGVMSQVFKNIKN